MRYKDAGVDIDKAERLVDKIKTLVESTYNPQVLSGVGGYAGLFTIAGFKNPVFGASTDGVGTKLKVAFMMNKHDTVGIDLVAMNVNDLVTTGLEPIIFMDYFACGKLQEETYLQVVEGIAKGCQQAECALIGGETAEMPDFYPDGEYDLAGFCVGVCEREELIEPSCEKQDVLIGIPSSGLHSNGYSLARKIVFEKMGYRVDSHIPELGKTIGEELLTPTKIYKKVVKNLKRHKVPVKGIAHITGGGLLEKPKRLLKPGISFCIYTDSWEVPPIFQLLMKWGEVPKEEMYRTFNMGIGMFIVVSPKEADKAVKAIEEAGEMAIPIGEVIEGNQEVLLWEGRF